MIVELEESLPLTARAVLAPLTGFILPVIAVVCLFEKAYMKKMPVSTTMLIKMKRFIANDFFIVKCFYQKFNTCAKDKKDIDLENMLLFFTFPKN
jgi:hypothetical protein